jgi:hypothetical protein
MAFQPNIPLATDQLSQSQADLQNNFQAIQTWADVNHVDFLAGNAGMHKFVQMPEQAGDPGTGADIGALYTKAVAGVTQLFWQGESNAAAQQLTGGVNNFIANGYSILGNGLIVQWGNQTGTSPGVTVINYPLKWPNFPLSLVLTTNANPGLAVANIGGAAATTWSVTGAGSFYYIAVGY